MCRKSSRVQTLAGHDDCVVSVAVNPDGEHVITKGGDCTAKVEAVCTGQVVQTLADMTST